MWEFTGFFIAKSETGFFQLLSFRDTIQNIYSYTMTVGSNHELNFEGDRIARIANVEGTEGAFIASIGENIIFLDDMLMKRSVLCNEGVDLGLKIDSSRRVSYTPVRTYSTEYIPQ